MTRRSSEEARIRRRPLAVHLLQHEEYENEAGTSVSAGADSSRSRPEEEQAGPVIVLPLRLVQVPVEARLLAAGFKLVPLRRCALCWPVRRRAQAEVALRRATPGRRRCRHRCALRSAVA